MNNKNHDSSSAPVYVEAYPVPDNNNSNSHGFTQNAYAPPPSPQQEIVINEAGAREFLSSHKWPVGLQDSLIRTLHKIPIRFFICDDSGSMTTNDGKRLVGTPPHQKSIACSRWSELTTALNFHTNLAHTACAKSEFRLLNGAAPLTIGDANNLNQSSNNLQIMSGILQGSPSGGTPLCYHVREVIAKITAIAPQLRAAGQKACLVIATDGESSDGDIASAMRPLRDLPVWVVIRLCTDEERIVNYWNNIDNELELDMDVLDDLSGEAQEVHSFNPWLTYGEPIHRLREFGVPLKEIDLLDEVTLNTDQIRTFCGFLFGGKPDDYPHPDVDWKSFERAINHELGKTAPVWNPIAKTLTPWINLSRVRKTNCQPGCTIC